MPTFCEIEELLHSIRDNVRLALHHNNGPAYHHLCSIFSTHSSIREILRQELVKNVLSIFYQSSPSVRDKIRRNIRIVLAI